jgi:hypothetical protein
LAQDFLNHFNGLCAGLFEPPEESEPEKTVETVPQMFGTQSPG